MTDWSPIIIGIVAALPPTILAIATLLQGVRTHQTFNSKMDKLLEVVKSEAFAAGKKESEDAQKAIDAAVIVASKKIQDSANQPN